MLAPTPAPITDKHRDLIETLCKECLSSQPKHGAFLKACAQATIAGSKKIDWQTLAPIWTDGTNVLAEKTVQNRIKTTASELRKWLTEYYTREDVNDSWKFHLDIETYLVLAMPLPGFPSGFVKNPKVSPREFANLVEDLVAAGPLLEAQLEAKVREWWIREKLPREPKKKPYEELLRRLRSSSKDRLKLKFDQMRLLAEALEVHSLMIDPLLARPFHGGCLYLRLPDFIRPAPLSGHAYGYGADYAVQGHRYFDSDANFVYLWLRPNGTSDQHSHVGDEIMIPLRGEVDLLLPQSGARVPLQEGEVAHFYAEQTHAAVNRSKDKSAFLFIIRSYHAALKGNSGNQTRQQMRNEIVKMLEDRGKLSPQTKGWLRQSVWPRSLRKTAPRIPKLIQDQTGLGRLMRLFGVAGHEKEFLDAINAIVPKRHLPNGRFTSIEDFWDALDTREMEIPDFLLQSFKELYKPRQNALFERFLFPGVPDLVVFRPKDPQESRLSSEFQTQLLDVPDGASYRVPTRYLSCSDVSLSLLRLERGASSADNCHAGFEVAYPLLGRARVTVKSKPKPASVEIDAANWSFAHYPSGIVHRVSQVGDDPAELLIIRFYQAAQVRSDVRRNPPVRPLERNRKH